MVCVSSITFFSTSKDLPDPNKPVCPGLSTRISDAIQRDVPLISWTKEVLSGFQTLTTAGIRHVATGVRGGAVAHPKFFLAPPKNFLSGLKYYVNMPMSPNKH